MSSRFPVPVVSLPLSSVASAASRAARQPGSTTGATGGPGSRRSATARAPRNGDAPDAGASGGAQAVTESGTITDLSSKKPVAGATVTAGDQSTTTAADGTFSLTLQKGEPFQLTVHRDRLRHPHRAADIARRRLRGGEHDDRAAGDRLAPDRDASRATTRRSACSACSSSRRARAQARARRSP